MPGNKINPINAQEKDGLRYTDFILTLADAPANESIPDIQGITEELSRCFRTAAALRESPPAPEYRDAFDGLAGIAKDCCNS